MRWVEMRWIGLALGASLAGALASPALADPPAAQPAAPPPQSAPAAPLTVTRPDPDLVARRMARRAARVAEDVERLRAGLHLTSAQDALWPPVAAAIRGVDVARGFRYRQQLADAPTPIDGLKLQGDHMAAMGVAIGRLADATKPLVASLTPDQKSRLPGLLQDVRLPKVMPRALGVPQDSGGGGSWGIGAGTGQAGGQAAGQRPPTPDASGATNSPKPTQDDEE